jgi:hypothetical protein
MRVFDMSYYDFEAVLQVLFMFGNVPLSRLLQVGPFRLSCTLCSWITVKYMTSTLGTRFSWCQRNHNVRVVNLIFSLALPVISTKNGVGTLAAFLNLPFTFWTALKHPDVQCVQ